MFSFIKYTDKVPLTLFSILNSLEVPTLLETRILQRKLPATNLATIPQKNETSHQILSTQNTFDHFRVSVWGKLPFCATSLSDAPWAMDLAFASTTCSEEAIWVRDPRIRDWSLGSLGGLGFRGIITCFKVYRIAHCPCSKDSNLSSARFGAERTP